MLPSLTTPPRVPTGSRLRAMAAPATVALGGVAVCFLVRVSDPTTPGGILPPCPTRALLGFTCPGCGAARMLHHLLGGDLRGALHHNALGLVALLVVGLSYLGWVRERWTGVRRRRWTELRWAPWTVAVIVSAWFVVRLLPFEPFTQLRV